ncbi:MAG: Flp pilus assembly complex ATPase component TadA [Deltaproteobacteria bacterium]|nr:Flp pilus assembly complex ATPase component TadA [Deltaproteobacteria bacterium]
MDIETRIKEAEIYRSMGLLKESLSIYDEILSDVPEHETRILETINKNIGLLKMEIEELKTEIPEISQENISIIKEALATDGSALELLNNAEAFKDLGLMKEAVAEYEKLFEIDYPAIKIIPDFVESLLGLVSPNDAVERVGQTLNKLSLETRELAQVKYSIGLQLEHNGNKDLAVSQFKSASEIDPKNKEIGQKLSLGILSFAPGSRYSYLLKERVVTVAQLQQALAISKKVDKSVEFVLIDHFKISKEAIGKSLSEFYGCNFKDFDPDLLIPVEIINNLKKPYLLNAGWVPLSWGKRGLEILIDDPKDLRKIDQVRGLMKANRIRFLIGIREDIESFINLFFREEPKVSPENMLEELDMLPYVTFEEEDEDVEDETEDLDESSSKVVKLIDQVIVTAFRNNASDIHIEPSIVSKRTAIRFRIDGVCQEYIQVPISMARGMLSRIKIMAGLDIAEKRLPQDGKIKFKRKGIHPFELRLATVPTTGGFESAALRILAEAGAMKIEDVGLNERNMMILKKIISQPHGLILAAGPTGSGKTTTLHAALGVINKPDIKIWTAEDPVEITQQGLSQVQIKPKICFDFERALRSFLRADPDVIMIGEMRDYETASTAIKAALTGHLVFSTLHTNSAPETVIRLLDMGLNPLNFSDAFLGVLAQRLIRRLCLNCRKEYHPSKEEFEEIVNDYGAEHFEATGIRYSEDLVIYQPGNCYECSETGYKGRIVIHELMESTPQIKQLIKENATSEKIFAQAVNEGMTTLKQDGIHKVFQGITDILEVRRICMN